ncbi:hypothetical protein QAD02_007639 [Eretmocerus hayati]|uniref:Uncharacterized protein n=1 Tax=Eretmocerus hayati TaxID=131215 RepID=A0ACC2N4J4_9HYME|nr:hypothetical protein QAD02_007639 [Eretmocerus hayati]
MSSVDLRNDLLVLTLKLYDTHVIPRAVVQSIIDTLISFATKSLSEYFLQEIKIRNVCDQNTLAGIRQIFEESSTILESFDTEHKRFQIYRERGLLLEPQCQVLSKSGKTSETRHISAHWILKTFLELPGCLDLLLKHMNAVENEENIMSNIVQFEFWRKVLKLFRERYGPNFIVIPIAWAHDDSEPLNVLGSHAGENSLGDVFLTLPGFPPSIVSKLENIFLVDLFYAKDRKEFGNIAVYSRLITELNSLQRDGLGIEINDKRIRVYFQPCYETGDNKGLNEDLGCVSYSTISRPCRICRADISQIQTMIFEVIELLRTKENYSEDCRLKIPSGTGIIEECCFNELEGFQFPYNSILDLMHDVFEGGGNITMTHVLYDLIYKQGKFSLDYLNNRITWLNKTVFKISNAIPMIKDKHITVKKKLKMSSAEMMNFIKFFGVLVGERIDDADENDTWTLFIRLRKLTDLFLSPRMVEGHIMQISVLVPDFLFLYIELYGPLTYKLYNFIHIIRVIRKFGPLIYYWAMRLESKQRELKLIATTSCSSVNLLQTISLRSQLKLAYSKLTRTTECAEFSAESIEIVDPKTRLMYSNDVSQDISISSATHLKFKGIELCNGMLLVSEMGDDDLLTFGVIKNLYIVGENVMLLLQPYTNIYFDSRMHAYHVGGRDVRILKNANDLPDIHPCTLLLSDGLHNAIPDYIL